MISNNLLNAAIDSISMLGLPFADIKIDVLTKIANVKENDLQKALNKLIIDGYVEQEEFSAVKNGKEHNYIFYYLNERGKELHRLGGYKMSVSENSTKIVFTDSSVNTYINHSDNRVLNNSGQIIQNSQIDKIEIKNNINDNLSSQKENKSLSEKSWYLLTNNALIAGLILLIITGALTYFANRN